MPKLTNYSGHTNYNPNYYTANNILFSSNPTQICNQVTFDYSGPNEDGIEYTWDFGDGSQAVIGVTSASNQLESTSDNTHVYAENGTYTVSLTLVYPGGCSYTYSIDYDLIFTGNIPEFNVSSSNVTDCDYNDGAADVEILSNPNFGPFTYLWNDENSSTTSSIINLPMNEYTVKVTNNQGCVAFGSTVIGNGMITFRPNGYHVEIGANETWSSTAAMPILMLKGVVYIDFGATLTIDNATVQFAYDVIEDNDEEELTGARFQVNEGGTLKIINSTLTGCNEGIWDGIESRGSIDNSSLTQLNNATIKNAKIGVTNDRRNNFQKNLLVGGIIKAENSQFINNRLGIELKNDKGFSYFKDCQFNYNINTFFTYPAVTEEGEWNVSEMTFVHLKGGKKIRFQGNNFETNIADFDITERGRGIFSESSDYSLKNMNSLGNGNNTFKNLTKGIEKIESFGNLGRIVAIGNTFTNIPYGITDKSGFADVIQENTFTNIPSSDLINNATFGIFMIGSSDFSLTGNNFIGSASINAQSFGSHGIVVENAGSIASTCFDNKFKGTDYGVHTQGNNINFKIRCNVFSEDGFDHNIAGIYVYDGVLRDQGNSLCDGDPSQAAGNTWLGPKDATGESITSYADLPFTYYANPYDLIQNPITFPTNFAGSVTINPTPCSPSTVVGGNCISSLAGLGVYGSASWYESIYELIASKRDKIKYYKLGHDYLLANKEDSLVVSWGNYDSLVHLAKETIEWYRNENQFFESELLHAYFQDENFKAIDNLFSKSASSELCKLLSFYFLNIKEYKKCHQTLDQITFVFENEEPYMEKTKSGIMRKENDAFIEYMNIVLELAENELTILDISPKQYDQLKNIIEQKMPISVMAESDLYVINNSLFEHPIYKKGGEKSMKVSSSIETNLETIFEIYPNPSSDLVNIRFELENISESRIINIYDALGKKRKSVSISDSELGLTTIDCSDLTNGFYTCTLECDKKIVGTKKLVIIK